MHGGLVADVPVVGGLREVMVVPSEARREHGLRHIRAPDGQESVASAQWRERKCHSLCLNLCS